MTIPKDIPEKWFPIILPLKRKKEGLTNTTKIRNGAGTFALRCQLFTTDDLSLAGVFSSILILNI